MNKIPFELELRFDALSKEGKRSVNKFLKYALTTREVEKLVELEEREDQQEKYLAQVKREHD